MVLKTLDLKTLKNINNTKPTLPRFENGAPSVENAQKKSFFSTVGNALGSAASWVGKGIGSAAKTAWGNIKKNPGEVGSGLLGMAALYVDSTKPVANADDFFNNARVTQGSLGGYMYDILGDGGESAAMSQVSANTASSALGMGATGAATGAAIGGPWGAAIGGAVGVLGGIFGGSQAKKAQEELIRIAGIKKHNKNEYGYYNAKTLAMQDNFSNEYGDLDSLQLTNSAANGKRPTWSPYGLVDAKATAWVSNGEIVGNLEDGYATRIPGRKNNKDTKLAHLKDGDFVLSNKYGISDYAALSGDYIGALNLQEMLLGRNRNMRGYRNGKLPGLEDGFSWAAALPSIFNAAVGLNLIARSKEQLSSPSSYVSNPYEQLLPRLKDMRVNTLPIYNNNRELESKTRNAIVRSGGLGAGQLTSALLTGAYNTMLANANALMNAQLQNALLESNGIKALYEGGAQDAARRTADKQWNYEKYAGAHNAAQLIGLTGLYNIANAWREGYKNQWERTLFEQMMDNYRQKLNIDKIGILAYLKSLGLYDPTQQSNTKPMSFDEYFEKNPMRLWNNKPSLLQLDYTNPVILQDIADKFARFNLPTELPKKTIKK